MWSTSTPSQQEVEDNASYKKQRNKLRDNAAMGDKQVGSLKRVREAAKTYNDQNRIKISQSKQKLINDLTKRNQAIPHVAEKAKKPRAPRKKSVRKPAHH
jgi:hypothetical protein